MNRMLLGAFGALAMLAIGLFWLQGRAQVEEAAPPPELPVAGPAVDPDALPSADVAGLRGPAPPESDEITREQRRFFRFDRNRDGRITRNEMLATRTNAFRKLDKDGNNLLTFEEWAVTTATRFSEMDRDGDGQVRMEEQIAYNRTQDRARAGGSR